MEKNSMLEASGGDCLLMLQVGGETYKLAKIGMGHLKDLQIYALDQYREGALKTLEGIRKVVAVQLSDDNYDAEIVYYWKFISEMTKDIMDNQGNWVQEVLSPRGVNHLLYLLLKENHPEIEEKEAETLFSVDQLDPLVDRLRIVLGVKRGGEVEPIPPEVSPEAENNQ